ncbi:MAG: DUF6786 family protein [Bacteroidota bacterium]
MNNQQIFTLLLSLIGLLTACQPSSDMKYTEGTFGYDLARLQAIEGLEVLEDGDAMIAVSGPFQARILTSTAKGKTGSSYGWVNFGLIEKDTHGVTMAYLGGESRMWFAPEWGPNALFFPKGVEQVSSNMLAPAALNNNKFKEISRKDNTLNFGGELQITNNNGYTFDLAVERSISLLSDAAIAQALNITLSEQLAAVGFSASTIVKNMGRDTFSRDSGLIAIWELGCMLTSPDNRVIIPLREATDSITEYFTPIAERVRIKDGVVYYKADALGINKIGIPPQYAKNVMGSYDPSKQLLNIVTFSFERDRFYVNSVPDNTTPYQGDVINIFNGVLDETAQIPFYEFESSSSAKELQPQQTMQHRQTTYHFEGEKAVLNEIAQKVLGVSLDEIPAF